MNIHGYEVEEDAWKVSNMGHTALGTKGGKRFFLKRYGEYKMPRHDDSTSPKLYAKMEREFNDFKGNRIKINEALGSLAGPGGNIILPTDWFVDDIYYIEATEFVDNLIEDEEILSLPQSDVLFIMLTAAGALMSIHRKKIVHSDLKRTNILAARNSSGKAVAKIIDFDRSYFVEAIRPDELGGDQSFMSPELAQCFMYDLADEVIANLSLKSDVYSLGLVFHDYLVTEDVTGSDGKRHKKGLHPKIVGLSGALKEREESGKTVYCCEAQLAGAKLVVSSAIKDKYLRHLIAAMIQLEPEDRPSAQEVLEVLKTKTVIPLKKDGAVAIEGETEEEATAAAAPRSTSSAASTAARPAPTPAPAPAPKPAGFCAAWPEHGITFDEGKLRAGGYVASAQFDYKGTKCYNLYKSDGVARRFTVETLVLLGFATRAGGAAPAKPAPAPALAPAAPREVVDDGTLWDKDSDYCYDMDAVTGGGYKGIGREERKGVQGYSLIKTSGELRFMTIETLKMLGFVKKK